MPSSALYAYSPVPEITAMNSGGLVRAAALRRIRENPNFSFVIFRSCRWESGRRGGWPRLRRTAEARSQFIQPLKFSSQLNTARRTNPIVLNRYPISSPLETATKPSVRIVFLSSP